MCAFVMLFDVFCMMKARLLYGENGMKTRRNMSFCGILRQKNMHTFTCRCVFAVVSGCCVCTRFVRFLWADVSALIKRCFVGVCKNQKASDLAHGVANCIKAVFLVDRLSPGCACVGICVLPAYACCAGTAAFICRSCFFVVKTFLMPIAVVLIVYGCSLRFSLLNVL